MTSTKAAVVREKGGAFLIEDVDVADPRPGEVAVRLVASGICHTDLLARDQVMPPAAPAVLGHEGSGVVTALGAGVDSVAVGDRVVLAPMSCGQCRNCRSGHPMHCAAFLALNLRGRRKDGSTAYRDAEGAELNGHFFGQSSFSSDVVVHERSVVRVEDVLGDVPLELLAPMGCGLQTGAGTVLNALRPAPGSSIAVFGAGTVGLAAVMAARIAGCDRIVAVDLHDHRLELAQELGATHVCRADAPSLVADIVAATGGGADFAVDGVGLPRTARAAVDVLNIGGTAAVVGSAGAGQEVSLGLSPLFGRTVKGVVEGDSVPALLIPQLIAFHRAGRFPFDRLIRTYPFEEIERAVADTASGATVKPVLVH
ncbi:aryl-alcohol dehydrogenase [Kitasatospora sp. MAA4]|uniref:NAD(P)-dependent alcohol dehydrogenase n=1 Tax=Kitasatospora sp. MAA4 TaxID=3035093 RepID=UPI002473DB6E|nr:NAD(P)-dependent alcohol dehydrogenase [Kitasatospora sp. MAA4]MDH6131104.1 aryl-alcohol dehydrogenase [Kitasatospora sp. MAA4]